MTDDLARKVARAELSRRIFIVVSATLAVITIGVVVWGVLAIRTTQQQGSPAVKQIIAQGKQQKQLLDTINSCIKPDGECAKQGAKNQAAVVAQINKITLYAQACSNLHPGADLAALQKCVRGAALNDTSPAPSVTRRPNVSAPSHATSSHKTTAKRGGRASGPAPSASTPSPLDPLVSAARNAVCDLLPASCDALALLDR